MTLKLGSNVIHRAFSQIGAFGSTPSSQPVTPDDHSKVVPLLPIPNRTVKYFCADDSGGTSVKVGHCQAFIAQTPCRARGRGFFMCSFYEPPWPCSRSERLGACAANANVTRQREDALRPSTLTAVQSVWARGEASGITRASGPLHRHRLLQWHPPKAFRSPAGRAAWRRGQREGLAATRRRRGEASGELVLSCTD
jgi:hypothetical protein